MAIALNLPRKRPTKIVPISLGEARANFKSKFVPRAPKDGEQILLIQRPQVGPYEFLTYAPGDLIADKFVCLSAKAGFTRRSEYGPRWEQLLLVRAATDEDRAAVAFQRAAEDEDTRLIMDRMMSS